ncbi:MAG: WecB/TagA/CpsF family glycosyltransferase [Candidatus Sumerlaeaceae bacterium]|nr:WecB/TagA/CpsF family glycosyltransferase [Candidatus Sumerlaeaceae bacterium]
MREPVDFLGIPIVPWTTDEFEMWITDRASDTKGQRPVFVTYLNAWCSNVAARDPEYADILRAADAVYADGQAVVWASALLRRPVPERVNAADFIVDLCQRFARAGVSIYLLGSQDGVAARAAEALTRQAPGLRVVGAAGGYWSDNGSAAAAAVAAARPDVLLVGLGVPMQEKWAWSRRPEFHARVIWCVGAMFEYFGGARARAPRWVRRAGLEWLFRLILEPRRLWRRYLVGNAVFVWRVLCGWLAG